MKLGRVAAGLVLGSQGGAFAAGVSPYSPPHLEPEIESRIERILIVGDQPVLTRPIPAAIILKALLKGAKSTPCYVSESSDISCAPRRTPDLRTRALRARLTEA